MISTPRDSEFFQLDFLQKQAGKTVDRSTHVYFKELLDDALDAAETARVAPDIGLKVRYDDDYLVMAVSDNGPGMTRELIDEIINFDVLVSDKSSHRGVTRGQQGNAWKTMLGIAVVLGSDRPPVIEALGTRQTLHWHQDATGRVTFTPERQRIIKRPSPGTIVTFAIPAASRRGVDSQRWIRRFVIFNPHATFTHLAQRDGVETVDSYIAKPPKGWGKPLPKEATSAHRYTAAALEAQITSYVYHADSRGEADLTVNEFIRRFAYLKGTGVASEVRLALPEEIRGRLSDVLEYRGGAALLLQAMQDRTTEPSPDDRYYATKACKKLGSVGKEHYKRCFTEWFGLSRPDDFRYIRKVTTYYDAPMVVEVAAAVTDRPGGVFFGVNYSPTFKDPLGEMKFRHRTMTPTTGVRSFLSQRGAGDYSPCTAVAIHLITEVATFLNKDKSTLALEDDDNDYEDDSEYYEEEEDEDDE